MLWEDKECGECAAVPAPSSPLLLLLLVLPAILFTIAMVRWLMPLSRGLVLSTRRWLAVSLRLPVGRRILRLWLRRGGASETVCRSRISKISTEWLDMAIRRQGLFGPIRGDPERSEAF